MKDSSKNDKVSHFKAKGEMYDDENVKAYKYGNNLELVTRPTAGKAPTIFRIDGEHYADEFGEIHEYKKSDNKSQNLNSVAKTMKRLRRLISNNFNGGNNELWVTLTYAENMQDTNRLYSDFKNFIKRLRYRFEFPIQYIYVIEPQARGAWHCHVLLKTDDDKELYIPNSDLQQIWGHGFTKVKRLELGTNVAGYVTAYLSDMPVEEVMGENVDDKTKHKIMKGARLNLYPSGVNFYRFSRGINQPVVDIGTRSDLLDFYNVDPDDSVFYSQREIPISVYDSQFGEEKTEEMIFKTEIFRIDDGSK